LPYRVRWQDLKDLFRKAGTVLRADVSLSPDNRSRGYGTVLLATAEDAGRAVDMFNGYTWQTRILEVRPDRIPPEFISHNTITGASVGGFVSPAPGSISASMGTTSYGSNPIITAGPSLVSAPTNIHREFDYNLLIGLETPISTSLGGRTLFVGNVSDQWQISAPHCVDHMVATISLPVAGLEGSFPSSRDDRSCRCRLGYRRSLSRFRHSSACV
jgi:RNA recognition motif. (a.k.a. RRM, RBD, or RNP domain)